MRAGVEEVLPFEIDLGTTEFAGEAFGEIEGGWSSGELGEHRVEFGLEGLVLSRALVLSGECLEGVHKGFWDEHASVRTEVAAGIGKVLKIWHSEKLGNGVEHGNGKDELGPSVWREREAALDGHQGCMRKPKRSRSSFFGRDEIRPSGMRDSLVVTTDSTDSASMS